MNISSQQCNDISIPYMLIGPTWTRLSQTGVINDVNAYKMWANRDVSSHDAMYPHHDDVMKWKHFPRCWPFVRSIQLVTGEFPSQRPVLRSSDIFFDLRLNKRLSNHRHVGDLRRHRAHYCVTVMTLYPFYLKLPALQQTRHRRN